MKDANGASRDLALDILRLMNSQMKDCIGPLKATSKQKPP